MDISVLPMTPVSEMIASSFLFTTAHLNMSFVFGILMFLSLQAPAALCFTPTFLQLSLILHTAKHLFTLPLWVLHGCEHLIQITCK